MARKHRCGGELIESPVTLRNEDGSLFLDYAVQGFLCLKCGDKLIDYATAKAIQDRQTPVLTWTSPYCWTTQLDTTSLFMSSRSTTEVASVRAA